MFVCVCVYVCVCVRVCQCMVGCVCAHDLSGPELGTCGIFLCFF